MKSLLFLFRNKLILILILNTHVLLNEFILKIAIMKSVRPEVRGTTDFDGGAYPPPKTSPSYALTTLIIFRFGRAGRDR